MALSTEKIIVLDSVGSTNNYAMGLIQKDLAKDGSSVFALDQISGKGRLGHTWKSEPGSNITFSIITNMKWSPIYDQFLLSMAAALSVVELFERSCNLKAFVKWPNDVVLNDKKAAGILIENVIRGTLWQWAITGFGININQKIFDSELKATSLLLETNKRFDVLELTKELKEIFLSKINYYKSGNENKLVDQYNSKLHKRDQTVKLHTGNRVFETTIKGVSKEGKLQTQDTFFREWDLDKASIRYQQL